MANEPNKGQPSRPDVPYQPEPYRAQVPRPEREPEREPEPEFHDEHVSEEHEDDGEHRRENSAFDHMEPQAYAAPETEKREGFVGYPMVKYHPIYGEATANDPNEAHKLFQPGTDWFSTAELADMHRTHTEAMQVMHHNQATKRAASIDAVNGREPAPVRGPDAPKGIVRNSVAAQKSIDAGNAEPL